MSHSFPKIIWQTHNYKQDQLPEHLSNIAGTWKNLNPGWDYRYVDHEQREETVKAYPEIYQVYKSLSPMFQSDIWRYIVTYEHGGCYADMDSVCVKPLDYLLQGINPGIEMIALPIHNGNGNNHNYITKKHSQPMSNVFKAMCDRPNNLKDWGTWALFIDKVYSDNTVSKTFFVAVTDTASLEDIVAKHHKRYKTNFYLSQHMINNYGKRMKYLDFLQETGLSPSL
jgi:hypothetical protein